MKKKIGEILRILVPLGIYRAIRGLFPSPSLIYKFHVIKLRKERKHQIVVMGDSHSRFFSGATPETEVRVHLDKNGVINYDEGYDDRFCAFDLGPALAFNLYKSNTTVRALEKYKWLSRKIVAKGEIIIFAFGEIDIRAHIFRHVSDMITYESIVNDICRNYEQFLVRVSNDGYLPVVWGPIASQKDSWKDKAQNPAIGSEYDRNHAVEFFNLRMKDICSKQGWGFFTIFDLTMDKNYSTKSEYICDMCHLGDNAKELFEPRFQEMIKNTRKIV